MVAREGIDGTGLMADADDERLRIEFKGKLTVTEADGTRYEECATQTWAFSTDRGFVLTIHVGTETRPRVELAGTDRMSAGHIGEVVASALRAMATPPASDPTPPESPAP